MGLWLLQAGTWPHRMDLWSRRVTGCLLWAGGCQVLEGFARVPLVMGQAVAEGLGGPRAEPGAGGME